MKSGGWKHSDDTKARMRSRMTDDERSRISAETKARMADPTVSQRIRDGMAAASGKAVELQTLRAAWKAARPDARKLFLTELTNADA